MTLARQPLLRFLLLGGVLFAARSLLPAGAAPIHFGEDDVRAFAAEWQRETGRVPTRDETLAGLRHRADDELLLREALRLGLDRSDPVARSRMVQNLRFTDPASTASDDERLREARALGMARTDVVVRRRLVEAMRERLARGVEVDAAAVDAYVAAHPQRYALAARYRFEQRYFSGPDASARAAAALNAGAPRGEAFALGDRFAGLTAAQVARDFGDGFAAALADAPMGSWVGPLSSVYGLHLVRLEAREPAAPAQVEQARRQARHALREEREQAAVREALGRLRARADLQIDWPALAQAP